MALPVALLLPERAYSYGSGLIKFQLLDDLWLQSGMDKEDARYQTLEQLHERRKQVIRLHKRGIKVMELVQMSGYLIVDLKGRFI